eukprot:s338_g21.t1
MIGRCLAIFACVDIYCRSEETFSKSQGAWVASQASQEATEVQGLHPKGCAWCFWEEDKEESEVQDLVSFKSPLISDLTDTAFYLEEPQHDVVLSKSRAKNRYQGADHKSDQAEVPDWSIFPREAPWIPTTPAARSARKVETADGPGVKELQNAQPVVPPTSAQGEITLTAEEEKMLEHLVGVQKMGMELTDSMTRQLESLKSRQAVASVKPLTHGHLNRLNKVKSQVNAAGKKIVDLDKEWASFMETTMNKVREHAALYQGRRSDLLETYNTKLADLNALKQEMSEASRTMLGQPLMEIEIPEQPDLAEQMQAMQEVIDVESQVGAVDLTEDMEEDEMENDQPSALRKMATKAEKSFRASSSPLKVANQTLKIKAKEKEKEDKQGQ